MNAMATQTSRMLKKYYRLKCIVRKFARGFSTTNINSSPDQQPFLASKPNPINHTKKDIGLYYTIDTKTSYDIFFNNKYVTPPDYVEECITFQEMPIMIRKPAVEIINYLKNTSFDKPINKYVLYGAHGNGKRFTMLHVVHYAHLSNWMIVHVPLVSQWEYFKNDISASAAFEGLYDVPAVGSSWLMFFKNQNQNLIKKLDLKIQNDYKWNIKEENLKGESLLNLIDHGITRAKYSCDVINALCNEIKLMSKMGQIKTLVAIYQYSNLFRNITRLKSKENKILSSNEISCFIGFKSLTKADWHNGAAILSCSAMPDSNDMTEFLPLNRLKLEGFELLHPFIPIEVPPLTEKEMMSMLAYYRSKNWIGSLDADKELIRLSAGNPYIMKKLCASL